MAVFFPMCYLAFKSGYVMFSARKKLTADIQNYLNPISNTNTTPNTYQNANTQLQTSLQLTNISTTSQPTPTGTITHTTSPSTHLEDITEETMNKKNKWALCKKICVLMTAIIFWVIGGGIIYIVTDHYQKADLKCNNPTDSEILENPSLLFFENHCQYKVYPLFTEFPCQCRRSDIILDSNVTIDFLFSIGENQTDWFEVEIIESILRDWSMLESMLFLRESTNNQPEFHWNETQYFRLKYLRTIRFDEFIKLQHIGQDIQNLNNLEVLWIDNAEDVESIPDEIGELSNLRVLRMNYLFKTDIIPDTICNLVKLRALELKQTFSYIPSCLKNLIQLETLQIEDWSGEFIPEILTLPEIKEVAITWGQFSSAQLLGLPNNSHPDYATKQMEYNEKTNYYFWSSFICLEYRNITTTTTNPTIPLSRSVRSFLHETQACATVKSLKLFTTLKTMVFVEIREFI